MGTDGPVKIALLGAGARGELNLATLAKKHPDLMKIVAVAEPQPGRRDRFCQLFNIPKENSFADWKELVAKPQLADAVINALPCRMHYESAMAVINAGYHQLLEKPAALLPEQCIKMVDSAEAADETFMVALQSRYNDMYSRVRHLLIDEKKVGQLMAIDCAENIGYWHFALSYVRGIHYNTSMSHSFVMAKGIHDLDLVQWFAGAPAKNISSFGKLSYFTAENAPEGATERCADGCPAEPECLFSALKHYVDPGQPDLPKSLLTGMSLRAAWDVITNPRFRTLASVVSPHDISKEGVMKALEETVYGKCVFRSENNVVDHQSVSIEFENEVTASFLLNGFSAIWERTLNLHGTAGELRSADFSGRLQTRTYKPARVHNERIRYHGIIHGGGDEIILVRFAEAVRDKDRNPLVSGRNTLESHLICFAAEEARVENKVVNMADFRQKATEAAARL